MAKSELREKRNQKIKERYDKLSSEKKNGKRIYRHDYIITLLSEEFYLKPRTIEAVLYGN